MSRVLPSEWEEQSGILLSWPHSESDWHPTIEKAETTYFQIVSAITRYQIAILCCHSKALIEALQSRLVPNVADPNRLLFYEAPCNDTWMRDYGPISVRQDGRPHLLNFQFNAWGDKFHWIDDNQVTSLIKKAGAFGDTPMENWDLVLEGGAIDSNGQGLLLTTSRCLLNPNRNGQVSKQEMESHLTEALGVQKVLWLHHGFLAGDDTDCHIDTLARFCDPQTICYVKCRNKNDEHYSELAQMEAELRYLRQPNNEPFRLVPLPLPSAIYSKEGNRLPATYANFLILNEAVLAPIYEVAEDEEAIATLRQCFPSREIIPIDCRSLIEQHGSLHCITMQLPQGVLP